MQAPAGAAGAARACDTRSVAASDWSDAHQGPTRAAQPAHRPPLGGGVRVLVRAGPDAGAFAELTAGALVVGTAPDCGLVLRDPLVSRRHLEIALDAHRLVVTDLGSKNGTHFQGARVTSLELNPGAALRLGDSELVIAPREPGGPGGLLEGDRFGAMRGAAPSLKQAFASLARLASSDLTVLIQGETGTGKELAAEALHAASARATGPFVVSDLAAVAPALIEVELMGCVKGAAPGVDADRPGAFAQADGGTLLLDQVAELPLEMQPRLLRALERKQVKPVGAAAYQSVNVRVVATAGLDLRAEVEAGRFRADLYHRLAVARVELPPLRDRRGDIALLARHFIESASDGRSPPTLAPGTLRALEAYDWPGNVRELRNVVEQALSLSGGAPELDARVLGFDAPAPPADAPPPEPVPVPGGRTVRFKEAKERLIECWEREYLAKLLERASGNVSLAARRAGLARAYLHQLIKKHGLPG
jgi:DNA-binding NtrC family response regulator